MEGARRAAIPDQAAPNDVSSRIEAEEPSSEGRTFGLGGLLIELLLPVTLSSLFLLVAASYTRAWDLHTPVGLAVFGSLLLILSLFGSVRLDGLTLPRRRRRGRHQLLNRADPRSRLVKLVLGGVVVPAAAFAAANLVELPNHQTPMSLAIRLKLGQAKLTRAEHLGDAVLRAETPAGRVQGILALQGMNSAEALDQLLRMLDSDPAVPKGGSEYQALSKALASYGGLAKGKLLQRLDQMGPGARGGGAPPSGDLFERYLGADFEGLRGEIAGRSLNPATQAAELERARVAQAELERALSQIETDTATGQGRERVPALIMQAFLQMDIKQDADLLAFARRTAADATWSDAVRGQALLLIAKLGEKDDLDGLYAYLESPSASMRTRAMQAIAALQSRLAAAGSSG